MNYSLWKAAKKLKKTTIVEPPIKKKDSDSTRSALEKVNVTEHLQNIFKSKYHSTYSLRDFETEHSVQNIASTLIREVTKLIGETRDKKTPGHD